MRVSTGGRLSPIPGGIRRDGVGKPSGEIRCRVVRKHVTDRPPGRPDWDKIPSKKTIPLDEDEWERVIAEQAARDAAYGTAMSAQSEKLLVDYVSQSSPDRRAMYEILFKQYGNRLESYRTGDGSNMRNVNGMWEFDMTKAEARMVERFMDVYAGAYEAARGLGGRVVSRLKKDV